MCAAARLAGGGRADGADGRLRVGADESKRDELDLREHLREIQRTAAVRVKQTNRRDARRDGRAFICLRVRLRDAGGAVLRLGVLCTTRQGATWHGECSVQDGVDHAQQHCGVACCIVPRVTLVAPRGVLRRAPRVQPITSDGALTAQQPHALCDAEQVTCESRAQSSRTRAQQCERALGRRLLARRVSKYAFRRALLSLQGGDL
jgi:hypothetical protein